MATLIGLGSLLYAAPTLGALIELDPDNSEWFSPNGVVDGHGVTIRGWTATPPSPLSVWDQPYQKLYARSPYVGGTPYLGLQPSTGGLVFGSYGQVNLHVTTLLGGDNSYYHFLFDNPTDFVGVDLLWPDANQTEGVVMHAWAKDAGGVEQVVFSRVYDEGPAGTYTRTALFYPGITRIRIYAHDKTGFQGRYFGLDNFNFVNTDSASALHLRDGETIVAPDGLTLGSGDSLTGEGTIEGSLTVLGGTVSPGSSPGTIRVTGDFEQDAASTLWVDIAASQRDLLLVEGRALLAGTLELQLEPGYRPTPGEIIPVISYSDHEGEFDEIHGLQFTGGAFKPVYGSDGFYLRTVPEPPALWLLIGAVAVAGLIRTRRTL